MSERPMDMDDPCYDCSHDGEGCECDPVMLCKGWESIIDAESRQPADAGKE